MLDQALINDFEETLRGRLLRDGDDDYAAACSLYNAMIDKHPRAVMECANVADVISAVRFGRENGLDIAVKGGGHSGPGLALADDALVIDLTPMKGIRVDPEARSVRVEPGCTWGDVDHATHAFGLATVSGTIATTGVPGLTLGGGHGYLTRRHGLTIDNLLSADVVLADGRLVHASETENPDLLWAIRGGGGNFGVVTSFEFRLHPVDTVIAGPMFWPIERIETMLRWYRDWLPGKPRDCYAFFLVAAVPPAPLFPEDLHGRRICGLMFCHIGGAEDAEAALDEARAVSEPIFEHIGPLPYPALQSMFDGLYPPGLQWYWKGDFMREISDAAIAEHVRFGAVPTGHSTMHLYPIDGAVHDTPIEATAFPQRDLTWSMVIAGVDPDPENASRITDWARNYWQAMHPHSAGASYVNFMMEEGTDRIEATYGPNHARLRGIKAKYDPENLFHVNQNIPPA